MPRGRPTYKDAKITLARGVIVGNLLLLEPLPTGKGSKRHLSWLARCVVCQDEVRVHRSLRDGAQYECGKEACRYEGEELRVIVPLGVEVCTGGRPAKKHSGWDIHNEAK